MKEFNYLIMTRLTLLFLSAFICAANIIYSQTNFWEQTNGPEGGTVFCSAISNNGDIFVGVNKHGVYRSTDNSNSWMRASNGLPYGGTVTINDIAINSAGYIFVSTVEGIYRSIDNGKNWTVFGDGLDLDSYYIDPLTINNDGYIFVGTQADGVYRSTESTITSISSTENIPSEYNLFQNYPNPFNPTTKIEFGLPEDAQVQLIIYNILSEKVKTLIHKEMRAGYYSHEFNASFYASGIYIYRLIANDFVDVKKMLLVK
jgi:hypothetical protein